MHPYEDNSVEIEPLDEYAFMQRPSSDCGATFASLHPKPEQEEPAQ